MWPLSSREGGGGAQVTGPLKKELYFIFAASLMQTDKNIKAFYSSKKCFFLYSNFDLSSVIKMYFLTRIMRKHWIFSIEVLHKKQTQKANIKETSKYDLNIYHY